LAGVVTVETIQADLDADMPTGVNVVVV